MAHTSDHSLPQKNDRDRGPGERRMSFPSIMDASSHHGSSTFTDNCRISTVCGGCQLSKGMRDT